MAKFAKVTGSQLGTVSGNLAGRMKKARGGFTNTALGVAVFAAGLLGIAGIGASYFIDIHKNDRVAKRQKQVLAEHFRIPIAAQLGIDPNSVNIKDLEMAAQVNPMIANAIAKVDRDKNSSNRSAVMMAGGAGAMSMAVGGLPILSAIPQAVAHIGGSIAGGAASSLFDKDVLHATDMIEHISAQRAAGQTITSQDILMLRIAQNEDLQGQIKKQYHHPFHKMNAAQQQVVIHNLIDPAMLQTAQVDADKINNSAPGDNAVEALVVTHSPGIQQMAAQGGWAAKVGGPRASRGSFVANVNAERALAAQGVSTPDF